MTSVSSITNEVASFASNVPVHKVLATEVPVRMPDRIDPL